MEIKAMSIGGLMSHSSSFGQVNIVREPTLEFFLVNIANASKDTLESAEKKTLDAYAGFKWLAC